ncbi:MAG: DUF559 domain-containing protein [Candidatus Pacearchaeota archaeon]
MNVYKLNRRCLKCNKLIVDHSKTGYCNKHRDRSGKNNPFHGRKHTKESIEKAKIKISIASKNLWKDPIYREKVIRNSSKPRKESFKKEQSERLIKWYTDNPEQRKIRSKQMKRSWKEGKIEPTINSINDSKNEKEIRKTLQERIPEKNVRKITLKLENRWFYPDISIGKKTIIEYYGNYWHANSRIYKDNIILGHNKTLKEIHQYDKKRINILKRNGYNVLVIWQDEYLKNKEKTINNIIKFVNKYEN